MKRSISAPRAGNAPDSAAHPPASRAWLSAIIIFALTAIGLADRMAIAILIGPIKQDFGIGDFQASLLIGLAFTLFYVAFLIPVGIAADRFPRRLVLGAGLLIWSLATIACGFAGGFISLFILRMLVGAGEAAIGPCSHGIIGDSFARHALSKPLALQGIGFQVGPAAGVAAAGAILGAGAAGAFDGVPLLAGLTPWRTAFVLIGLPGLLALPLVLLLHEPGRRPDGLQGREEQVPLLPFLRANARLMALVLTGAALSSMALGIITSWVPEYLQRSLGVSAAEAGASLGIILLVGAVFGQGLYAIIVDWFAARGMRDAPITVGLAPLALAIPLSWLVFEVTDAQQFSFALLGLLLCITPFNALNNGVAQMVAPPALRSRISALLILCISIIGFAIAPAMVGWLSEFMFGEARLGLAMQLVSSISLALTMPVYMATRRPLRACMAKRPVRSGMD